MPAGTWARSSGRTARRASASRAASGRGAAGRTARCRWAWGRARSWPAPSSSPTSSPPSPRPSAARSCPRRAAPRSATPGACYSGRAASPVTPRTTTSRPPWPASRAPGSPRRRSDVTTVSSTAAVDAVAGVAHRLLAEEGVITDRAKLRTYECDGLAHYRVTPALVVIPEDATQLAAIVHACAEQGVPYVARGSGTGLSGGALPHADGVLI